MPVIEREQVERLLVVQERMYDLMLSEAKRLHDEGNERASQRCVGVAEGLSIGTVSLRCLLNGPEYAEPPTLEVVH